MPRQRSVKQRPGLGFSPVNEDRYWRNLRLIVRAGIVVATFSLTVMTGASNATPPPPDIPSFCGGVLCVDIVPIEIDGKSLWPTIAMNHAINHTHRYEYEIHYDSLTVVSVVVEVDSTDCGQALPFADDGKVRKIGESKAAVRTCARLVNEPNRWARLSICYFAHNSAERRSLVMGGTRNIWMAAINPELVVIGERAIKLGQQVKLDRSDFRYE